ncbi:hypothetical protein [Streptomyces mirabilis]|uniref:hypothetical protein n=1 Tax=Streptomyces mirabilis TaxID=68239 RepID=UPI002E2B2ECB|nr:hypothetical protein [Streptomyces mirabilis]
MAVEDRAGLAPREVYDLTVDGIHTFYVSTEGAHPQNLLVHNCQDLVVDEDVEGAHTIGDHGTPDDDVMEAKALDPRTGASPRAGPVSTSPERPSTRPSPSGSNTIRTTCNSSSNGRTSRRRERPRGSC